ncbi:DNA repair protein RecO [Leptospira sp. 96542]|nr:DNA repair protein RecO [Leptospira sp. 96542]
MAIKKERGIVLTSKDIGDSDRLISLAGEFNVRHSFITKGIRKSKRRPIAATEVGSLIELDFYDKPDQEWKFVKEIVLVNRFDELKSTYMGTLFIMYLCELTDYLYLQAEFHPFLNQLLLGSLERATEFGFQKQILPFFKLRALTNTGHFPTEFFCHTCGEEVLKKRQAYFSLEHREFLCSDCHGIPKDHLPVLKLFHTMLSRKYSKVIETFPTEFEYKEGDAILNQLLRNIFGKELKLYFEFYRTIGYI